MCKRVVDQTVPVYFVYKVENTFEMSEYIVPAEPRLHLVFILISMLMIPRLTTLINSSYTVARGLFRDQR